MSAPIRCGLRRVTPGGLACEGVNSQLGWRHGHTKDLCEGCGGEGDFEHIGRVVGGITRAVSLTIEQAPYGVTRAMAFRHGRWKALRFLWARWALPFLLAWASRLILIRAPRTVVSYRRSVCAPCEWRRVRADGRSYCAPCGCGENVTLDGPGYTALDFPYHKCPKGKMPSMGLIRPRTSYTSEYAHR